MLYFSQFSMHNSWECCICISNPTTHNICPFYILTSFLFLLHCVVWQSDSQMQTSSKTGPWRKVNSQLLFTVLFLYSNLPSRGIEFFFLFRTSSFPYPFLVHVLQMLSSKDLNFVGYTYKNFEIINDYQVPGIGTCSYPACMKFTAYWPLKLV